MGLMASFERGMERFLVPVAIKLKLTKNMFAAREKMDSFFTFQLSWQVH